MKAVEDHWKGDPKVTHLGALFAGEEFVAPKWLRVRLGLGPKAAKARDAFAHDILTFALDNAENVPVIVLPQDSSVAVLDRVVRDTYATRIVFQTETPFRSGYIQWLVDRFARNGVPFEIVYLK